MSLRDQAIEQAKKAGEVAAKVETDGKSVEGEVSLTASGQSWAAKVWAKVKARTGAKADTSAGVDVVKRW